MGEKPPGTAKLTGWLRRLLRGRNGDTLRETVEVLLDSDAEGEDALTPAERSMLGNLLEFGTLRVDDVMVPRVDIVAVEAETPLERVVELFHKAGHSRLPVYRESLDDPIGMVHVRDLLEHWGTDDEPHDLVRLTRQVLFVPPSMPVVDLLFKMRSARTHMALVVDEYGGIDGLATIEDVVELIVGEIYDEHDAAEAVLITDHPSGTIEADARAPLESLEKKLGLKLLEGEDEDADTVGGMLYSILGRIPARGEIVRHHAGLEFEVTDADPRRIKGLLIRRVNDRSQ